MKKNIYEYKVEKEYLLFDYLIDHVNDSKNNIKSFLKNGNIYVNSKCITKYNFIVKKGDNIIIKIYHTDIDILYEDNDLVIVNKDSGLLTISDGKSNNTLYKMVSNYVKLDNKNNKIFIVNRLDKDTSGIVVFAKSERVKKILQDNWNDIVLTRKYVAVVEGITDEVGTIKSYLNENKEHIVYSSNTGKLAITKYERVKYNNNYSMLNIYLYTGRKNQIRVHMKDIGHSVVGDKKYGSKSNPIGRLMLHCELLEFKYNNKIISVKCKCPSSFNIL